MGGEIMTPRRAVKQELTKDIILKAARELFIIEGYQHVSIRKIAHKLGYSHSSLYYHFNNKAALFYALVDQDFALMNRELDRIIALNISDSEKIREILLGYIAFGLTHPNHYEIMFMIKDEEIQTYLEQGPNQTYHKFSQSLQQLSSNTIQTKTIWSIFLMLHGFVAHYCYTGQSYEEVKELASHYVEMIVTGIVEA